MRGAIIGIDPGHGANDSGAVGKLSTGRLLREKDVVLAIGKELRTALLGMGWDVAVCMTRDTDDTDPSQVGRGQITQRCGCDLVLSIHADSSPSPAVRGATAYIWPGNQVSRGVARAILLAMPVELAKERLDVREAYDDPSTAADDYKRRARNVLRPHKAPTVLLECGYLSNASDCEALATERVRRGIVSALLVGVANYLGQMAVRTAG